MAAGRWAWATVLATVVGMAVAATLAPPATAAPGAGLAWVLFLGSSVHVAATGWLLTVPGVRRYAGSRPARYLWIPATLALGAVGLAVVLSPAAMAWVLLPYFCWQLLHFQKQNLGLAALAATAHGAGSLTAPERRALLGAGMAGTAAVVARPELLQLHLTVGNWAVGAGAVGRGAVWSGSLFALAVVGFAMAVAAGLRRLWRRPAGRRPAPFVALYLMGLLFFLPVFLTGSPYAAVGALTVAHGLQYLLLVGLVAGGERHDPARRLLAVAVLSAVALVGGVALVAASHLHGGSAPLRLLFGAYLGVVLAHFVVDGGLWRLRDPFPRAFLSARLPWLIGPGAPVPARATPLPAPAAPFTDRSVPDIGCVG